MISKSEKRQLKIFLRKDWVPEVLRELDRQNIRSSRGKPYSESMIRMVFIGRAEHSGIEAVILEVYKKRKQAFEHKELQKKQLLDLLAKDN